MWFKCVHSLLLVDEYNLHGDRSTPLHIVFSPGTTVNCVCSQFRDLNKLPYTHEQNIFFIHSHRSMSIHEAVQNDENVLQNTILLQTKASMTGQFLFSLNLFANSLDWYKLMTWHGTPRNIYTMLFVNQILYRFILIKN